jgi:MoaA/NifB/PqqE/SkfB family radical SAM enzyme
MTRVCLNPINWLDITAVNADEIQFAQCIRSWGGDECVIGVYTLADAWSLDVRQLWENPKAKFARAEVRTDGVAAWCKGCPRLAAELPPTVEAEEVEADDFWKVINLAYDKSCNLCCLSCRADPVMHAVGSEHYLHLMQFEQRIVRPLLSQATWAFLSGLGDPFGSPAYWHLLSTLTPEEAPNLRWHIQTNGLGFTRKKYDQIPTREQIASVQLSVDAAREATYQRIRGGNWQQLMSNLGFVGNLRARGAIDTLAISMVVQRDNWGQMHEFWQMGCAAGVDMVQFNCLLNQGTYDEVSYADRAVHLPSHPVYEQFKAACADIATYKNPTVIIEVPRE